MCARACRLSIYDDDDYNRIKPRERVGQWDGHTVHISSFFCVSFFGLCVPSLGALEQLPTPYYHNQLIINIVIPPFFFKFFFKERDGLPASVSFLFDREFSHAGRPQKGK